MYMYIDIEYNWVANIFLAIISKNDNKKKNNIIIEYMRTKRTTMEKTI